MKITIGRNTATPGYHAMADGSYRYGETRGEALGRLVMAFPNLLAPGVVIAHEDDPRPEDDPPGDSIVRELADAWTNCDPCNCTPGDDD